MESGKGKDVLSLESTEWGELTHAYGPATNIPDLLRRLANEPGPSEHREQEPWWSLWSSLCHQGDVYQASYVAVPHIVDVPDALGAHRLPTLAGVTVADLTRIIRSTALTVPIDLAE